MSKARKARREKARTAFDDSVCYQLYTFGQYLDLFTEIAISSFEWVGLPSTVDARFIEVGLYEDKAMLYFNDEVMGNLCLRGNLAVNLMFTTYHWIEGLTLLTAINVCAEEMTVLSYGII